MATWRLSQDAANELFGTGPLVTDSPAPVAYKDGGSYFDFKVPGNGLATRFEVFRNWGVSIEGDPSKSLQPANVSHPGNMEVGLNPANEWTQNDYFSHSYVTHYSIDFDPDLVKSVRKPSQVSSRMRSEPRVAKRS